VQGVKTPNFVEILRLQPERNKCYQRAKFLTYISKVFSSKPGRYTG